MSQAAIFLCAGSGTRMRGAVHDKVLTPLLGLPVLVHSLKAFQTAGIIDQITVVYRDEEQRLDIEKAFAQHNDAGYPINWVEGGRERQDSVFNALNELSLLVEYVFIHDCARPLVHPEALRALSAAVKKDRAAVLAHRVTDTIKKASTRRTLSKRKLRDVPRAGLWAMETPQAFEREMIVEAYRRLRLENLSVTDDTAALAHQHIGVTLVENDWPNPKLTVPGDLDYLEFLISRRLG
ncbi:2-C-methyl-D-erythritol 4-phosphate cytidylyltransferase [Ruficoccus amylovorans]|uniref:2-C-methyl-D-erythritol 4-phosphate cytidylyltransferase n=1 Tax=Ruficoccus amylovorans TaxID=1804625 RepID=A0A842HDN6_9BACT|nr:2-C-methyl-D-erythritol 4-phosphate cytidylyltransferase [Ruficoccus amylovorans]MBC2593654.1 2-C-methyl-D-erythritol 4-phosphate cytidylyltransferase [Ruficoccus amylovorans]